MIDDNAFLQAVLLDPDDDVPRLIYADWLEERGNPRAEFIRLQCELARLPRDYAGRRRVKARAHRLLASHGAEWVRPFRGWARHCQFWRGFVERVVVRADVLLNHADRLFRLAPLRHVEVDLTDAVVPPNIFQAVPGDICRRHVLLPLGWGRGKFLVAMRTLTDFDTLQWLGFMFNAPVQPVLAPAEQIVAAINRHYGTPTDEFIDTSVTMQLASMIAVAEPRGEWMVPPLAPPQDPAAEELDSLLLQAVHRHATELHIEPFVNHVRIRHRIGDGLTEAEPVPRRLLAAMVARIKVLAGMSLLERRRPQEGRIRARVYATPLDIEVSTLPTVHGPAVTLRIQGPGAAG